MIKPQVFYCTKDRSLISWDTWPIKMRHECSKGGPSSHHLLPPPLHLSKGNTGNKHCVFQGLQWKQMWREDESKSRMQERGNFPWLFPKTFFGPLGQPRPQGFSLKKWVGPHPFFKGKSPGGEVAFGPQFGLKKRGSHPWIRHCT